ncbi:MAG: hypothetical protein Q9204_003677 [Flavoplaca sp. TL-2023a]
MYLHISLILTLIGLLCQPSLAQENRVNSGYYEIVYCGAGPDSKAAKLQTLLPQIYEKLLLVLADVKQGVASKAFHAYFKTNDNIAYVESIFHQIAAGSPVQVPVPGAPTSLTVPYNPMIVCLDLTLPGVDYLQQQCKGSTAASNPNTQIMVLCDNFWRLTDRVMPLNSECPKVKYNKFHPDDHRLVQTQFGAFVHEFAHTYTGIWGIHETYQPTAAVKLSAKESLRNPQNFALYAANAATALTNQIIAEEAVEPTEEDATVLDSPPPLMEMFEPAGNATGGINLGELIPGTRRDGGGPSGEAKAVKIGRAVLQFKTAEENQWQVLDHGPVKGVYNIQKVVFDYNIAFQQHSQGGKSTCRVTIKPEHIGSAPTVAKFSDQVLEVTVPLRSPATPAFAGEEHAAAEQFPIATHAQSWVAIQIRAQMIEIEKYKNAKPEEIFPLILHHLTGRASLSKDTSVGHWVQTTLEILSKEAQAQEAASAKLDNCRIHTHGFGRRVAVAIWPDFGTSEDDQLRMDFNSFAVRYIIGDCNSFPVDLAKHFRADGQEEPAWEVQIVSQISDIDAPLVGVLMNVFKTPADRSRFLNLREDKVEMSPALNDVLGEAQRVAVRVLREEFDELSQVMHGYLVPADIQQQTTKLPIHALILRDAPYHAETNTTGVQRSHHRPTQGKLNASQDMAVTMAFERQVSFIWGPAATGKSTTLASLVQELTADPSEKVLCVMTRNVAVDALLGRCIEMADEFAPTKGLTHQFVRIYSWSDIMSQHLEGSLSLKNPYHIDQRRIKMAQRQNNQIFLSGRQKLLDSGYIGSKDDVSAYKRALKDVTQAVMQEVRVAFCTSAMCRSAPLLSKEKVDGIEMTVAWPATTLIFDELACSNPPEFLIPIATFGETLRRGVGAGDHYQLANFMLSEEAKAFWKETLFERGIKFYPKTILTENRRTHNQLAQPVLDVIYSKENVTAFFQTNNPRRFLQGYNSVMPLDVVDNGTVWRLKSFVHFIDVGYGQEEISPSQSKRNRAEVEVCVAVLKALFQKEMPIRDTPKVQSIGILTGYASQVSALRARFKLEAVTESRFAGVHVRTADSIQGGEFDLCLVSLVSTQISRGFVGEKRRANVIATRSREVMIYIGNWKFWESQNDTQYQWMDKILYSYRKAFPKTFILRGSNQTTQSSTTGIAASHSATGLYELPPSPRPKQTLAAEATSPRTPSRPTTKSGTAPSTGLTSPSSFFKHTNLQLQGKGKAVEKEEQHDSKRERLEDFDKETNSKEQAIRATHEAKMDPLQRQIDSLQRQLDALRRDAGTELDDYRAARKMLREKIE